MQPQHTTRLEKLVGYIGLAASTAKTLTDIHGLPFLSIAATIALSIADASKTIRANKDQHLEILAQIHEIFFSIIILASDCEMPGMVAPSVLHSIAKFTENLQKLYNCIQAQQRMGKFKQLLKHSDNATQLEICRKEFQASLHEFRVHIRVISGKDQEKFYQDAEQQHQQLLEVLAANPTITDSESVPASLRDLNDSTTSLSLLPSTPQIFHGRDSEMGDILEMLKQDAPRIAILGPGGIGKTSVAAAILNHPDIVMQFPHRHFVPCHSSPTCADLVSNIASHIGVDKATNLSRKIMRLFTSREKPSLLILDNFETPWEPQSSRSEVEEFLSSLAAISALAIVLTVRGAERPPGVRWTRPFLPPLQPLDDAAALQTFMDIADAHHNEDAIRQVLALTANLPLAVNLIANIVSDEGCETTLNRWAIESTRVVSDGYDKKSSLDISIMLSFSSSRMTVDAQNLLGLLSTLPDGLSDADLLQAVLPLPNVFSSKSTLMRTALAYLGKDGRLRVLNPIAEHIRTIHPPPPGFSYSLRTYFHEMLNLWKNFDELLPTGAISQITANLGNLNIALKDALQTDSYDDAVETLYSVLSLDDFCFRTNRVSSPLMQLLNEKIDAWRDHPVYSEFLIHNIGHAAHAPVANGEAQCISGTEYFEDRDPMQKARWFNGVGIYHRMQRNDITKALDSHHTALALADSVRCPSLVARKAITSISMILLKKGNHTEAQQYASKAQEYAQQLGDIPGESYAMCIEAKCWMALSDFRRASSLCATSRVLLANTGLKGGTLDIFVQQQQAEIHFLKTEYSEAQRIHQSMIESTPEDHQPTVGVVFSRLNLALIMTATRGDEETVKKHLAICSHHFSKTFAYPTGKLYCDMAYADLHLRAGNLAEAGALLQKCYKAARGKVEEGATFTLERLSDLSNKLFDVPTTLCWVGVYLASALKSKDKLATMKAFRCLAEISAADGDAETAFNLFEVAVDGFTFMDVHRWRGICMVRMGDILIQRGEHKTAAEFWTEGRDSLARCLQAKEVAEVERKLEMFREHAPAVSSN
ncbi:NB-ARC domain-containing protein [Favolaschia claudopus]|uniref:NB-ARC domain-containing protein n=1 Tax=Favolaschia claudopus TaxID=2862362 RepID=A0AAW0EG36_9AGAR